MSGFTARVVAALFLITSTYSDAQVAIRRNGTADSQRLGNVVELLGVPENGLIRWPAMAVRGDTIFIAANVARRDTLTSPSAYLGRLRQNAAGELIALSSLGLPPGDFQFAFPRIIPIRGTLHLVWAEFASRPRTTQAWQLASMQRKSIWHAALDHGIWSTPEKIVTADLLGWDDQTGSVAADASGTLHIAAWVGVIDSISHVRDYRLSGGHWRTSILPYIGQNEVTALTTRGDTALLALVAEVNDTARVIILESIDHGNQWGHPVVASSRPREKGSVSRLAFAAMPDRILLAIGEKPDDSFYLDTIRVVTTTRTIGLSATHFVTPPSTADQFVLAGTSCGSAVLLSRALSTSPVIFEITIPTNSVPAVSRPLLGTGFSTSPGIISTRRSSIATFVYNSGVGKALRNAAMAFPICPP